MEEKKRKENMISILSKEIRRYFKTRPTTPIVNNDLCQCAHPDKDYSSLFLLSFEKTFPLFLSLFCFYVPRKQRESSKYCRSLGRPFYSSGLRNDRMAGHEREKPGWKWTMSHGVSRCFQSQGFRWHLLRDNGNPCRASNETTNWWRGVEMVAGMVQER